MIRTRIISAKSLIAGAIVLGCFVSRAAASPALVDLLHQFSGQFDGGSPNAVIIDGEGNLYGTMSVGGGGNLAQGAVFELTPSVTTAGAWNETILHVFEGGADGATPYAGLVRDSHGNLYGTTSFGGGGTGCRNAGCGTVFELRPTSHGWRESVLYAFTGGSDGSMPSASLILDKAGNLYGTTEWGGDFSCGTVFRLTPPASPATTWTESVLHTFTHDNGDGNQPDGPLLRDAAGNLYGTTYWGGAGWGTVFKVAPDGTETILYAFKGTTDGYRPQTRLAEDKAGNIYGTTTGGGWLAGCSGNGCGTIFKLAPDGMETTLYQFGASDKRADGAGPTGDLILDRDGTLYGATQGSTNPVGGGAIFKFSPDGTETVLYAFPSSSQVALISGVISKGGSFYGSGSGGVDRGGLVFKLTP